MLTEKQVRDELVPLAIHVCALMRKNPDEIKNEDCKKIWKEMNKYDDEYGEQCVFNIISVGAKIKFAERQSEEKRFREKIIRMGLSNDNS